MKPSGDVKKEANGPNPLKESDFEETPQPEIGASMCDVAPAG